MQAPLTPAHSSLGLSCSSKQHTYHKCVHGISKMPVRCRPSKLVAIRNYRVKLKYQISYSLFKKFSTYLRDRMKWGNMMLWSWGKAKAPGRWGQFSTGGSGVQIPTEGTTMLFLVWCSGRLYRLWFCSLNRPMKPEVSKWKTWEQKFHWPVIVTRFSNWSLITYEHLVPNLLNTQHSDWSTDVQ